MKRNPKILYLPGKYPFCYYYRGYLPGVYSNQFVVKDFVKLSTHIPPQDIVEQAKKVDVVVLQRPNTKESLELVRALKKLEKKVIFENDDTYLADKGIVLERLENNAQRDIAREMSHYTNEILKACDGAIASTEVLAEEYAEINPNVAVVKNCIDPFDEFPVKKNTTGKFRIGLIGSVTTNDDYVHIKDQIRRLDERGDITFVVFGVKYPDGSHLSFMQEDYWFWNSLKSVEWQPYVNVTEYMMTLADLALDLAIIPRQQSYFNRCKSNLKFLECSLLHIPVLAQAFSDGTSPYQGKDAKYMTLTDMSWYKEILEIKDNYQKYKKLAEKAYKYVLKNYNIHTYAPTWTKTINKLIK